MEQHYTITGMTCGNCVAKVKQSLEELEAVKEAQISLNPPQGILKLDQEITTDKLQKRLAKTGNYVITQLTGESTTTSEQLPEKTFATYRPLILIIAFIAGVGFLAQYPLSSFSGLLWMRHFMAGFFIVFAFFKLLNLEGFANTYRMYDLVAGQWKGWGFIYPFVELALGIMFLTNIAPLWTNVATVVILGISSIGVIKSNLNKQKIKCACLGDVFNLPMSTVTIVEDVGMVAMAGAMLVI